MLLNTIFLKKIFDFTYQCKRSVCKKADNPSITNKITTVVPLKMEKDEIIVKTPTKFLKNQYSLKKQIQNDFNIFSNICQLEIHWRKRIYVIHSFTYSCKVLFKMFCLLSN